MCRGLGSGIRNWVSFQVLRSSHPARRRASGNNWTRSGRSRVDAQLLQPLHGEFVTGLQLQDGLAGDIAAS
jgi:hypothetical protein